MLTANPSVSQAPNPIPDDCPSGPARNQVLSTLSENSDALWVSRYAAVHLGDTGRSSQQGVAPCACVYSSLLPV
jgi:hypothetical protein